MRFSGIVNMYSTRSPPSSMSMKMQMTSAFSWTWSSFTILGCDKSFKIVTSFLKVKSLSDDKLNLSLSIIFTATERILDWVLVFIIYKYVSTSFPTSNFNAFVDFPKLTSSNYFFWQYIVLHTYIWKVLRLTQNNCL